MDDFIQDLKKNLSVDNIVVLMKDANVMDDMNITEEEVRNTLGEIDTEKNVDEIASKLKELSDIANKRTKEAERLVSTSTEKNLSRTNIGKKISATRKEDAAGHSVFQKPSESNEAAEEPKSKKAAENIYKYL